MYAYLKTKSEDNVIKIIIAIPMEENGSFLEVVLYDHGLFQAIDESKLGSIGAETYVSYDYSGMKMVQLPEELVDFFLHLHQEFVEDDEDNFFEEHGYHKEGEQ